MSKADLIASIADEAGISKKDAERVLKAFTSIVTAELRIGGSVQIIGFGTFQIAERAAHMGRNPQTGAEQEIPACKVPKFKAGKSLKDAVNA